MWTEANINPTINGDYLCNISEKQESENYITYQKVINYNNNKWLLNIPNANITHWMEIITPDNTYLIQQPNINRLELINHAKNNHNFGRIITLYKELNHFNNIELSYQDYNQTLKIFIS